MGFDSYYFHVYHVLWKNHKSISVHARICTIFFIYSFIDFFTMFLLASIAFFLAYTSQIQTLRYDFIKEFCCNMISNFLNPILFRICIEKFNHQMHILIRISAQKLPRRRLEGGGATVFYVVVQRVRSRLEYQIRHSTKLQL